MDDLISRQAAIEAMNTWDWQELYLPIHFKQLLEELPSAQPERKTGKWEKTITHYPYCSICEWMPEEDEMTHGLYNFCPNCGAKMEG